MSTQETRPSELGGTKVSMWRGLASGVIVNLVLVVAIVLSVLWLPPVSLVKRLVDGGYTVLGEGVWSITDSDGTQFTVLPEGLSGTVKARLSSVPRSMEQLART